MAHDERLQQYHAYPLTRFKREDWHKEISQYLSSRFLPIAHRLNDVFRYVDPHPLNKDTFSYELASILRDIGSVFSSVMDAVLVNVIGEKENGFYNIDDFTEYLFSEINDLDDTSVALNTNTEENYFYPFEGFKEKSASYQWWKSFNNIKHNDIKNKADGNLSNVLYSFAGLSILYDALVQHNISYFVSELSANLVQGLMWYRTKSSRQYESNVFPLATSHE